MERKTELSRAVAIVGRPNVGKSRLFNALVGRRISIVHDQPGVTRDLITAEISEGRYTLMDTGGIGLYKANLTPKVIAEAVEEQVDFALAAASLVLLVVDITEGCARSISKSLPNYVRPVKMSSSSPTRPTAKSAK